MLRFRIAKMSCGGCAKRVTATLKEIDPSADLQIDLQHREVRIDGATADPVALETALAAAGWKSERLAA